MTEAKRLLDEATPLPWTRVDIRNDDDEVAGALFADHADGALILYAVNRLPDYEATVDALERIALAGRMYKEREFDSYHALMRAIEDGRAVLARLREGVPA